MKIAVSACLLGENVRYDGGNKLTPIIEQLKNNYQIIPICPETEAGLGIPRLPMHLIKKNQNIHAVLVADETKDFTKALKKQAMQWLKQHQDIAGFILKARSPSCAYQSLPLGNGIFTEILAQTKPNTPIIDEEHFANKQERIVFLKMLT